VKTGTKEPREADSVAFGCYKREVFEKIGLFNERFTRSQDLELNLRLKKAGGKILLVPSIVAFYYPSATLGAFFLHNFIDGSWVFYPLRFGKIVFSWRHLIPFIFVFSLISAGVLSIFFPLFLRLFLFILIIYLFFTLYFSIGIALKEKNFKYLFVLPIVFVNRHFGYGLGSFYGLFSVFLPLSQGLRRTKI